MEKMKQSWAEHAINFITRRKSKPTATVRVVLSGYSQPHMLQHRMREQQLTHGQRILADLDTVRLDSMDGLMVMYFCSLREVKVVEKLTDGDSGSIPDTVTLHGVKKGHFLEVPLGTKDGLYKIKNLELFSNGTIQVHTTEKTKFIPV